MDRNIRTWAKGCLQCQQHKISRYTKTETTPFSLPSGRFETIHIDIISPLPPTTTYDGVYISPARYVLTCIDRETTWAEATPLQNTSASTIALAFLNTGIAALGFHYTWWQIEEASLKANCSETYPLLLDSIDSAQRHIILKLTELLKCYTNPKDCDHGTKAELAGCITNRATWD